MVATKLVTGADYQCWQCGQPLLEMILPLSRREQCPNCQAEIHVCRQCIHFDERVASQCREDRAEDVSDKQRANFCDYHALRADAFEPRDDAQSRAQSELEALFGGAPAEPEASNPLDDLFDADKLDS